MYKDPDRQREASAGRQRRYKAKQKALLSNIPKKVLLNREKALLSEGVTDKALPERTGVNLESLGIAAVPNGHGGHKLVSPIPKRGKDIKHFGDLPMDVQETIDYMSTTEGKLDKDDKAKRTAAAIHYQHVFPDRYEGTGFSLRTYEDGARQPIGAR